MYVSFISDFNQMYTASDALIIGKAAIDTAGYFSLKFAAQKEPALYRLHIIKKGDPAATLIIGGKDVNHVFFIGDTSHIYLNHPDKTVALNQAEIGNTPANESLKHFFAIINPASEVPGDAGRQLLKNRLINLADSSSSQIVSLLAISYTFGLDEKQKERIGAIVSRLDKHNAYGANIFEQYQRPPFWYIAAGVMLVIVATVSMLLVRLYRKRKALKMFSTLSQREVVIIKLIANGKSNKEIANELNVELSTVKTHVNNLYAKLNVKDRKEILMYNTLFKKYGW